MSDRKKPTKEELLAMQQPSTRALLTDDVNEAKDYFQSLKSNIFVTQEDMDSGKVAKPKDMSVEEKINAEVHRKHRGGTQQVPGYLTELWKEGDATSSEELKDKALKAYMSTPGVSAPSFEGLFAKAAKKAKGIFKIRRNSDKLKVNRE